MKSTTLQALSEERDALRVRLSAIDLLLSFEPRTVKSKPKTKRSTTNRDSAVYETRGAWDERILDLVKAAPKGIASGEIGAQLPKLRPGQIRTRLQTLKDNGLLRVVGVRRQARWFATRKEGKS